MHKLTTQRLGEHELSLQLLLLKTTNSTPTMMKMATMRHRPVKMLILFSEKKSKIARFLPVKLHKTPRQPSR